MNPPVVAPGDELRLEPSAWEGAVSDAAGPQIIVGGPGTGKTEFLVRRAGWLLAQPDVATSSLLILSFGRRGVADLRDRIRSAVGSVGDLDVATFHSYAARLMEAHGDQRRWDRSTQLLTGPEQIAMVGNLLLTQDPARWSPAYRDILHTKTFAEEVTDFVLRAAEHVLDPAAVAAMGRADWRGVPEFLERYDAELRRTGRIDYGTLLREAVLLVESGALGDAAMPRFTLVDEYQDTTLAQARLVRALSAHDGNLTVAADPYQSIYSFRGARLENVAEFPDEFRDRAGNPGRRIVLTTSFRTPAAILDSAVNVTARVLPGAAGPVAPAAGDGRVDVYIFGQQTEEAEWVASEVERIQVTQGIALRRIGVLVRSKQRFLSDLSRALERRGIAHDLPDSRLADHPAVRFVLDLVTAASGDEAPAERARALRRLLLGPIYQVSLGELRAIERSLGEPADWPAALAATGQVSLAGLLAETGWANSSPAAAGAWQIWAALDEAAAIAIDPDRQDERLAWRSLVQVLERWNERNPEATLDDYRRLTESEEFEAQPLLSYRQADRDRLTVTTLHQAKGLDFHTVFICDAVEGVFPDLRPRDSLLGVRHLMAHLPTDSADYTEFRLQEERRLAYTAMTRAEARVVWTATSVGAEAGRGVPSRFLPLVVGRASLAEVASSPPGPGAPVSPREAEAVLRRVAADPAASSPDRIAAIAALADGSRWGMRPVTSHTGVVARGPSTNLNRQPLRLSPSQADNYAQCPRKYAIERRLFLDGDSVYTRFGSLIHQVLDDVESEAMRRGQRHSDYPTAVRRLDELLDPADFGGEPFATAWRRRAQDGLARLYGMWPSDAMPVAAEREVSVELADVIWRGRIDRVESDEAGMRIVDYKTSRNPASEKEAAQSLQLGFYALAAGTDPTLAQFGEPVAAELWYPLARNKKSVATRSLEMAQLPAIGQRLIELGLDIAAERWDPTPGDWCDRCAFKTSCPAQAAGGPEFA